jgi:hypothetical protein
MAAAQQSLYSNPLDLRIVIHLDVMQAGSRTAPVGRGGDTSSERLGSSLRTAFAIHL